MSDFEEKFNKYMLATEENEDTQTQADKDKAFREKVESADIEALGPFAGAIEYFTPVFGAAGGGTGLALEAVAIAGISALAGPDMAYIRNKDRSWKEKLFGSDAKKDKNPKDSEDSNDPESPKANSGQDTNFSELSIEYCTEWATLKCGCASHYVDLQLDPFSKTMRPTVYGSNRRKVATIMDFIDDINIPRFTAPWVMCFNILNPVVFSLSVAKALITGTFTIIPYPCMLSRLPSPFSPTWKCSNNPVKACVVPHIPKSKMLYKMVATAGAVLPIPKVEFPILTKDGRYECLWPFGGFTIYTTGRNDNPVPYNAITGLVGPSVFHCLRNLLGIALNYIPFGKIGGGSLKRLAMAAGGFSLLDGALAGLIAGFESDAKGEDNPAVKGILTGLETAIWDMVTLGAAGAVGNMVGGSLRFGPSQYFANFIKNIIPKRFSFKYKNSPSIKINQGNPNIKNAYVYDHYTEFQPEGFHPSDAVTGNNLPLTEAEVATRDLPNFRSNHNYVSGSNTDIKVDGNKFNNIQFRNNEKVYMESPFENELRPPQKVSQGGKSDSKASSNQAQGESQKGQGESQKGQGESQKGQGESQKGQGESLENPASTNKNVSTGENAPAVTNSPNSSGTGLSPSSNGHTNLTEKASLASPSDGGVVKTISTVKPKSPSGGGAKTSTTVTLKSASGQKARITFENMTPEQINAKVQEMSNRTGIEWTITETKVAGGEGGGKLEVGTEGGKRTNTQPESKGGEQPSTQPENKGSEQPSTQPENKGSEQSSAQPENKGGEQPSAQPENKGSEQPSPHPENKGGEQPSTESENLWDKYRDRNSDGSDKTASDLIKEYLDEERAAGRTL